MLVRTLLEMPELRLTVRSRTARLDRAVTGVYSTELPDPSRYVTPGQLVVSGLLWWRGPEGAEVFVRALAQHDIAALAASGADTNGIPEALVRACERHRVTLLEVPPDLSFAVITEQVVLGLAAAHAGGAGPQQRLLAAAAQCSGLPELLDTGAKELGASCWVLTASGRVAAGTADLPGAAALAAELRDAGAAFQLTGGYAVVRVPSEAARALLPWYLVVETGGPGWRGENRPVAEQLAALVGLERVRTEHDRQVEARAARPLLRLLAAGSAPTAELSAQLAAAGVPTARQFRVIAAATPERPESGAVVLDELLTEIGVTGPVAGVDERAYAIVDADSPWPATPSAATEAIEGVARLQQDAARMRVLIGISAPAGVPGLLGAAQEAQQAVALGELRTGPVQVVNGAEIPPHQLALASMPSELRTTLRRRVLGPVLDYDAAHGTDLVGTLRIFLECSGSWTVAADRLHVHVNTLRYRIGRIAQLTGVDLDHFASRVDLFLALRTDS